MSTHEIRPQRPKPASSFPSIASASVRAGEQGSTRPQGRRAVDTRAVHAGRGDLRRLGVHAPPIDLSSTYPLGAIGDAAASLDALASGREPVAGEAIYSRLHGPTAARFEDGLAALEGATGAVTFASGMAALTACLLALRSLAHEDGRAVADHVVAVRPLYGGSDHLLSSELLGLRTTWARADEVAAAITPETLAVIVETPANPTLDLVDIADVAAQIQAAQIRAAQTDAARTAGAADVALLVDSTFATPVLQRPLEHGADLVLHSATKFLGGHGDVLAGVVAASDRRHIEALRRVRGATGGVLHPLAAYLLHRGLPTLPLRVRAAQTTANELAQRLARHPRVGRVLYPGLEGHDPRGLVGRQMDGPGTLLAFEAVGGAAAGLVLLDALELITPAVSLGSVDTLIQMPAAMTHHIAGEDARAEGGVTPAMLRLSVGLEDVDDLWRDLDAALQVAHGGDTVHAAAESVGDVVRCA
ncbi:MAG: PLP-dependent transferase [Acidobacteriota bacterium]